MTQKRMIPISAPMLVGNEKKYVLDCLETTWISSLGKYIEAFEDEFATFCDVEHAIACSNGTTALHLALLALGVEPGDKVIVPTLTYVATANAVRYCGAEPIFVDGDPATWNIDPARIEELLSATSVERERIKGIIVVHLFGHPVDMAPIRAIADRYGLFVLEDAAEAHGAEYHSRKVGGLGDMATFSFFGNKILSTGEGGMITTGDERLAAAVRQLKNQGMDPKRRYWFPIVGYNYRMTNICAAIGLAQLEKVDWHLERRRELAEWYRELLADMPGITWQATESWARHVWWMFTAVLDNERPAGRDGVIRQLAELGVEARQVIFPIHHLPPYARPGYAGMFPVADRVGGQGLHLPSWGGLSRQDVEHICDSFRSCLARCVAA